ncbi:MAG: PLP-dependent aminotransferase family protein [Pseudodesulfovibrio sp.]
MTSKTRATTDMLELGRIAALRHLDPDPAPALRHLAEHGRPEDLLHCADSRGLPDHRSAGADWVARFGLAVEPENILVCTGAQHAACCCLAALARPGHRIAVDALSYPGFLSLAAPYNVQIVPVTMDAHGMLPDRLDALCRSHAIHGLYLMPTVHNPTALCMPTQRREALAALARKHDLLIIEDDAYALTRPDRPLPLAAHAPERTLFIAGLTKTLAPGLRIGYLAAPPHMSQSLARAVTASIRMTPPITAAIAAQWIADGTADRTQLAKQTESAQRQTLAHTILGRRQPLSHPHNYFLWLPLPAPWTAPAFEQAALERGVNVRGAHRFSPHPHAAPAAVRVSLTAESDVKRLKKGLEALAELLDG